MGRKVKGKLGKSTNSTTLRKVAKQHTSTKKRGKKKAKALSVDELLEMAEECIEMFQIEEAETYCRQAVEMEPNKVEALELLAVVLLEGHAELREEALLLLKRAVELQPDDGHQKYMYLAQMLEGTDALESFLKGILIMEKMCDEETRIGSECAAGSEDVESSNLSLDLSNACCSVVELYMTDLCDKAEAESQCEAFCLKALEHEPGNPEALQMIATFLLSTNRVDEARERIK